MYGWKDKTGYDIYEVYTQPRTDYLKFRLYNAWWTFMWKSRIERLQDRIWDIWVSYKDDPDDLMPPGAERDFRHYHLDTKNQTVLGRVEVEGSDIMINRQ